jgi:hypothetical protein
MVIVGAGLTGLIAGAILPNAAIFEKSNANTAHHRAVLRFRSDAVGRAVGIDFRKVKVRKAIWSEGRERRPSIKLANAYSQKVIGKVIDRSIWNLEPAERFIAPEDFQAQLAEICARRISYGADGAAILRREGVAHNVPADMPVISTIPMPALCNIFPSQSANKPSFTYQSITVDRWRVPGADVHQTIYFPDDDTSVFRASITGDLLIVESAGEQVIGAAARRNEVQRAFGIAGLEPVDSNHIQRFGKIAPIDDGWRKSFMGRMTLEHNIYSLGRFATWRNILLDDVVNDVAVIKRLINSHAYDVRRFGA